MSTKTAIVEREALATKSVEVERGYDFDSGHEYKLVRYDDGRWAVKAEGMTLRISKDEKEVRAFFSRRLGA